MNYFKCKKWSIVSCKKIDLKLPYASELALVLIKTNVKSSVGLNKE